MARDEKSFKRTWQLMPEPGYETVDAQVMMQELMGVKFALDRLGLATTIGPLRYRRDSNGEGVTFGYEFHTAPAPAMTEAQAQQMMGYDPDFALPPDESAPPPDFDPREATATNGELDAALTGAGDGTDRA